MIAHKKIGNCLRKAGSFLKKASSICKTVKNFVAKNKKHLKSFIKTLYSIIDVLSTLTIFSALIFFIIGKTKLGNINDDDLTMHRIRSQLPDNLTISDIHLEDIHSLGNDSMIVLAVDDNMSEIANQLLIFDKVDNNILNQVNNPFGYGSNYKLSYSFSLEDTVANPIYSYSLEIIDIIDLTGDLSKEIIVKFMPYPSGNGAYYQIGIFSYSYETHTYYLLGTYPRQELYDVDCISDSYIISTIFHKGTPLQNNYYDKKEIFELEYGSKYNNDFFVESKNHGTILIRTEQVWGKEGNSDPHKYTITLFEPIYDHQTNELYWNVLFSKESDAYMDYCSQEYVLQFLEKEYPTL